MRRLIAPDEEALGRLKVDSVRGKVRTGVNNSYATVLLPDVLAALGRCGTIGKATSLNAVGIRPCLIDGAGMR